MSNAFVNSDQMYGVKSARVSGGGNAQGIMTGAGVLFTVSAAITSGAAASGQIIVFDGVSGATVWASGSTSPVLFYNSGGSTIPVYAPAPFFSGLCVSNTAGGVVVTVTYRAGI